MRNLGVLTALALSWITASCAERMVSPTVIPEPVRTPQAGPKPPLNSVEARRQTETIDARKRSAIRPRRVSPSASFKTEQPPEPQTPLPQELQQPQATPTGRAAVAVPPPTTEPDASDFPYAALMPPPPEPAEPSFPVAVLMPPPPEPAEPSLPSREEATAEIVISIPFPDLSAPLSLYPRFEWEEVTGSFDILHSPLSEVFDARPERQVPTFIRSPWLLP
jgi:hypothetical protein